MKVEVTDIEACKRRLAVEAPVEVVTKEWERAYGRIQKQARLPGFRKGHVPRSLVKVHFADDVRREVAEHLIPEVYRQALTEAHLDPVNEPDIQDLRLEEGAPLSFVALVEVKPEIALDDYVGLEIQHAPTAVTGERVDEALEHMRERQAEFRAVDRVAGPGDLVIVDYTLNVEGEEPASQTGYAFVIGDGSVMAEIDTAAAGMRAGEERAVGFRFPDDHRRESLRGKSGTASLKVVEVKEKILPALDDELAKSMGDFENVEALRAEVVKQLETRQEAEDRHALEDKVVDALLGRHQFGVPDSLVMRQIAMQVEHARDRMRRQGVDPDGIAWDYGKLVAELRPSAERAVRRALLVDAIADREGLTPSDADVDAEVDKIAQATQRPAPAVRRMMEKSGDLEALRRGLRERMTMQFLIDRARITPAAA
jgi:trigger factor